MRWRQRRVGGALLGRPGEIVEPDSFERFYAAYAERVLVFHTRRVMDVEVALDLTAETFARALELRRQFRGTTAEEEQGWLFSIARTQLSRYWRRGSVERSALQRLAIAVPELTESDVDRVEALADMDGQRGLIGEALQELSDEQRSAIELRIVQELDYAAAAEILGVSEQVVRARVSRGLRVLAARLSHVEMEKVEVQ